MALTQRGINIPVTGQITNGDDIVNALIAQGMSVDTALGGVTGQVSALADEVDALLEDGYVIIEGTNLTWPDQWTFNKGSKSVNGRDLTITTTTGAGDLAATFRIQSGNIAATEGDVLRLSVLLESGTGSFSQMQARVMWWTAEGSLISSAFGPVVSPGTPVTVSGTAPATTAYATFWVQGASGAPAGTIGDTATFTEFIISEEDIPFFDGDSGLAGWTGTPGASPSLRYSFYRSQQRFVQIEEQIEDLQEQIDNLDPGGDPTPPFDPVDPEILDRGLAHRLNVEQLIRRHGGPIGVGAKPVVCLRFDDYLADFSTKVLPTLQEHKLPASIAVNVSKFGGSEFGSVTPNTVQGWAYAHGIEVWNHGRTHLDAEGKEAIYTEIVTGLTELRAALPNLMIDGWIMPGTADPTNQYDGLGTGYTLAHWTTYAGQLILTHHAIATGTLSGQEIYPLAGTPQQSMPYINMDTSTAATVQARLERLTPGTGTCLMIHPGRIDTGGYMSQAEFENLMAWLADERDAGNLVVLTMSGMAVADCRTETRFPLLPMEDQALTAGVAWSRSISMLDKAWARGTVWEAVATVTTTGAATVTLSATDEPGYVAASHEYEFTGAGTHTLRCHFTLPRSQTHPLTVTVFTEDSGVSVTDCGAWSV